MSTRSGIAALVAALAVCVPRPTLGQSPADVAAARDLFMQGSKAGKEGRWAEAEKRFSESLALKRAAITFYSLGVAQKEAGHLVAALESFRAFLIEPSSSTTLPYEGPAREAITELERRVGKVTIQLDPPSLAGLVLLLDGQPVPNVALEHPRLVDPGSHALVVTAPGYLRADTRFSVNEGGATTAKLSLAPVVEPPKPAEAPHGAPRGAGVPAPPDAHRGAPTLPPDTPPSRVLPITLMAAGGAVLAGGLTVGLLGFKEAGSAPTRDGPEADSARRMALAGDILAGVGAAGAGVGLILLLVRPTPKAPKVAKAANVAVDPWLGPGRAGVTIRF